MLDKYNIVELPGPSGLFPDKEGYSIALFVIHSCGRGRGKAELGLPTSSPTRADVFGS